MNSWLPAVTVQWTGSRLQLQEFDPKAKVAMTSATEKKCSIQTERKSLLVVKEDGQYKILDTDDKPNSIALEMLDRIKAGDLKGAKALLDWLREDHAPRRRRRSLGGATFPRSGQGQAADARKMNLAAAAILIATKPPSLRSRDLEEPSRMPRQPTRKNQHPTGAGG